jgi:uncharacterized protein (TIGR02145 family)
VTLCRASFFSGLSDQKNAASSMKKEKNHYSFFLIPASIFKLIRLKILELRYLPHLEVRLVHDKAYAKGGTYKKWADNPKSQNVHRVTAFAFAASFIIFTLAQALFPIFNLGNPSPALAGSLSHTWSSYSDFNTGTTKENVIINGQNDPNNPETGSIQIDEIPISVSTIGTQTWMNYNMNVGNMIHAAGNQGTSCINIEKYCHSNLESNCTTYGGHYQWSQAMCGSTTAGAQGICPAGFRIPTDANWHTLESYLTNPGNSCDPNRSPADLMNWGCDPSGSVLKMAPFNALRRSWRETSGGWFWNTTQAKYWSSSQSGTAAWVRQIGARSDISREQAPKTEGPLLRCIQDPDYLPPPDPIISSIKLDSENLGTNWSSVTWTSESLPSNTEIIVNARTSNNGTDWSSWSSDYIQNTSGTTTGSGNLSSLANARWIDFKITFVSDGVGNPTLNSLIVEYENIDSPVNLKQYRQDNSEIPSAGWNNGSTTLKADVETAASNPSTLTSEIEMNTTGTFSGTAGTPTGVTFTPSNVSYTGSPISQATLGSVSGVSEGNTYYWKARYIDGSGRVSPWSETQSNFSIEQTPPTGTVTINEGEYTKNATVNLTLSAADTGGSGISEMRFSNNGTTWTDWEAYATSKEWTITEGDGEKTVYVQYQDNAGNNSGTWLQTTDADFNAGLTKTDVTVGNNSLRIADNPDKTLDPENPDWVDGRSGTAMEGRQVYFTNETSQPQWKIDSTACLGPQCEIGLDQDYSLDYALINNQVIEFTNYPAQNSCLNKGGRLPYTNELLELYNGRSYYGNNFGTGYFWSATEATTSNLGRARGVYFSNGSIGTYTKTNTHFYTRCVRTVDLSSYKSPSFYGSSIFDFGSGNVQLKNVNFTTDVPTNTSITLSARAGNTPTPDGTWTSYYTLTSGQNAPGELNNKRYLQYRATLTSSDGMNTPTLHDITFDSLNISDQITLDTTKPSLAEGTLTCTNRW